MELPLADVLRLGLDRSHRLTCFAISPVKGVIIGDGTGLEFLKKQCAAPGLEDRIVFLRGRWALRSPSEIPQWAGHLSFHAK